MGDFGFFITIPNSMSENFFGKYSLNQPIPRVKKDMVEKGFLICPDNAIIKVNNNFFEWDYDYCKGCGLCSFESPLGVIDMEKKKL